MEPNERDREAARDVVNQIGVQTDIMQGLHDGDIESIAQVFAQAREDGRREGLEQAAQVAEEFRGRYEAQAAQTQDIEKLEWQMCQGVARYIRDAIRALIEKVSN